MPVPGDSNASPKCWASSKSSPPWTLIVGDALIENLFQSALARESEWMRVEWAGEKMRGRGREVRERQNESHLGFWALCSPGSPRTSWLLSWGLSLATGVIRVTELTDCLGRPFLIICHFYKLTKDQGNIVLGGITDQQRTTFKPTPMWRKLIFSTLHQKSCNLNRWFVLKPQYPPLDS